jgi:hypothetical protein
MKIMPQVKTIAINGLFFFWFGKPVGETRGEIFGEPLGETLGEIWFGEPLGNIVTFSKALGEIVMFTKAGLGVRGRLKMSSVATKDV